TSFSAKPQSTSRKPPPGSGSSTTSALPSLPLPRLAKRTALFHLFVKQRDDPIRDPGVFRRGRRRAAFLAHGDRHVRCPPGDRDLVALPHQVLALPGEKAGDRALTRIAAIQ